MLSKQYHCKKYNINNHMSTKKKIEHFIGQEFWVEEQQKMYLPTYYTHYPDLNNVIDYFQDRKQTIIRITKVTKEIYTHTSF